MDASSLGFFSPRHACDSQLREQTGRILIAVKYTDTHIFGVKKKRFQTGSKKEFIKGVTDAKVFTNNYQYMQCFAKSVTVGTFFKKLPFFAKSDFF